MKSKKIILTFFQSGQQQNIIELLEGHAQVITVGSQGSGVDVVLKHALVSRVHAQIVWDGNTQIQLIDSGSTNGSFVNGVRIVAHQPKTLHFQDHIAFGSATATQMALHQALGESMSAPTPPPLPPQPQASSLTALLAHKPEITLGRQADCDVQIDHEGVSRLHAKLRKLPDGRIFLIDLGSTNGTFLNGQRVQGNAQVQVGDKIIIGRSVLSLDGGPRDLSGEIAIRTEAIIKSFKKGKIGLQACSMSIPAGSLVAIMGPSGCGKSTLLKCLTGEAPATSGKVYLHNLELIQNYPFLKTLIGYVPQDDIVHKELTVEQSLYFAAKLRMERPTKAEIDAKIDDVLQRLRIAHIRQSPIAKISGGQRKRVSIAVELLTDPLILFLDEPTSPLDPQTIEEFLKILQELAQRGTTVVMVTHKPEDLEYMDSVIFMAEGGAMVYDGAAKDYKAYFEVRTAVEVYANISGERAKGWIARFQSKHRQPASAPVKDNPRLRHRTGKGMLGQAFWLSARYLRIKTNDRLNVAIMIGQSPIIAALVCIIFNQISLSVPFMITLSAIWFGTSNAAREIVGEAAVYRRERMFNLQIAPYIFSKLAVLSLVAALQAALFCIIIWLRYQNTDPQWHEFVGPMAWVWLLTIVASVMGLMVSALVNSSEKAMSIVPLVLIPQVMLSGIVARIENGFVEVMSYLSPSRWGNEGLCLIQGDVHPDALNPSSVILPSMRDALQLQFHHETYQSIFGALTYKMGLDLVMLVVLALLMLTVLVIAMKRKDSI